MKPFCAEGGEITDEMCEKITLEWFKEQILFEKKNSLKVGPFWRSLQSKILKDSTFAYY